MWTTVAQGPNIVGIGKFRPTRPLVLRNRCLHRNLTDSDTAFEQCRLFRKCDDSKPTVLYVYSGRSHVESALLRGSAARPVVSRPWVSCLLTDYF
jgi:hypothetical protein